MDNNSVAAIQGELNEERLFRGEYEADRQLINDMFAQEEERWLQEQEQQLMAQLEYRLSNERNLSFGNEMAAYRKLQEHYGKAIAEDYAEVLGNELERIPDPVLDEIAAAQIQGYISEALHAERDLNVSGEKALKVLQEHYGADIVQHFDEHFENGLSDIPADVWEKMAEAEMQKPSRLERQITKDVETRQIGDAATEADQDAIRNQMATAERTSVNVFIYDDKPDKAYVDVVMHYPDRDPVMKHVTVPIDLAALEQQGITPNHGMEQYIRDQLEKGNISEVRTQPMIDTATQMKSNRTEPLWATKAKQGKAATHQEKRYLAKQMIHNPDAAVNISAEDNKAYVDLQYPSPATGQPEITHVTVKLDQAEMDRRGITPKSDNFKDYVAQQIKEGNVAEIRDGSLNNKYNQPGSNTMQQSMEQLDQQHVNTSGYTR